MKANAERPTSVSGSPISISLRISGGSCFMNSARAESTAPSLPLRFLAGASCAGTRRTRSAPSLKALTPTEKAVTEIDDLCGGLHRILDLAQRAVQKPLQLSHGPLASSVWITDDRQALDALHLTEGLSSAGVRALVRVHQVHHHLEAGRRRAGEAAPLANSMRWAQHELHRQGPRGIHGHGRCRKLSSF